MALRCAACGRLSRDEIYCEHCRVELAPSPELPPPHCPLPPAGVTLTLTQTRILAHASNHLHLETEAGAWRVHWLGPAAWERWRDDLERRQEVALPSLPPVRYQEDGDGAWVIAPAGLALAAPWAGSDAEDALTELNRLVEFLHALAPALESLHTLDQTWLNFDPLELELATRASTSVAENTLRFTNLDLALFQRGEIDARARLRPHFLAPEILRGRTAEVGPASDVYHLGLFAYYWLAGLLPEGFPGLGLEAFGYRLPPLRTYAPWIPPGLARVLRQACAPLANQRPQRPAQVVLALEEVATRWQRRLHHEGDLSWEIGAHTRVGRTKGALGRENEDQVLVRTFSEPERALLAVADGISTCDVGTGRLASWLTVNFIDNAFDKDCAKDDFLARIPQVCLASANALVGWAIKKGYSQQLQDGADLMGTTLTAAWIQGRDLHVANLGDSRAYLIDDLDVEQLTVDGDLGSGLLAQGYPPETLVEIGGMAKALRECIGGCRVDPDGTIGVHESLLEPGLFQLPLLPGDVIVLCTDGLVDEGMFLEPDTLRQIVRTHYHRPAQEIAEVLADCADALQRLPSPMEPDGYGDNVSVIVVKVTG